MAPDNSSATKVTTDRPLIADLNQNFLDQIQADPAAIEVPPILVPSGKRAQLYVADEAELISSIFINPSIGTEATLSLIRITHLMRPLVPIFLMSEAVPPASPLPPFEDEEIKRLGVRQVLKLPLSYAQIKVCAGPNTNRFDARDALNVAKKNNDAVDTQISESDSEFVAIRAKNFVGGTVSAFDIYIKLGSGRFIKLIQAGDLFLPERVAEYVKKGVEYFYLRKEAQELYLAYCDRLSSALLKQGTASVNVKVSQTLNHGEETLNFLQDNGMNANTIQYAANFASNVTKLVNQLSPGKQPLLKGFLNDLSSYSHGVATSMIAGLLIKTMDITSAEPTETVGMASLLHDIGLYSLKIDGEKDEDTMTFEEKQLYYSHPMEGASIMAKIGSLKPVVIQAIEQHHERRTRKGFPLKLGAGSMSIVSEIVGLADEFSSIVQKVKKDPKVILADEINSRIMGSFSSNLINEFKRVFLGGSDVKRP